MIIFDGKINDKIIIINIGIVCNAFVNTFKIEI